MKSKKQIEDYLNELEAEYEQYAKDFFPTDKEMVIIEIQIETLEWVLK